MQSIKKFLLVAVTGILGLLLTLAGLSLITISQTLILYVGIGLLGVALVYYFLY